MKDNTREMIKRMRGKPFIPETKTDEKKKSFDMRDMLKITRNLNENNDAYLQNKITTYDQKEEEDKMKAAFDDYAIDFIPLEVYNGFVYWGGTLGGVVKFAFSVTNDEKTSTLKIGFPEDSKPANPEEEELVQDLEKYYQVFKHFWRKEMLNM